MWYFLSLPFGLSSLIMLKDIKIRRENTMSITNMGQKQFTQTRPDNSISLDISSVTNLQIGYQAESIFLKASQDEQLVIKEYINGLSGTEYYAKIAANRFKTTIRYGRREEVNQNTFVEVFLPVSWHGQLQLSSLYGDISTEEDWSLDRLEIQANEGSVSLKSVEAPRIRIVTAVSPVLLERAVGFVDIHTVSGTICAKSIHGGAKLATSDAPIFASFEALNNIIECTTLNGVTNLILPKTTGIKVDGVSKRGQICSEIEGLEIRIKPGNVSCISGILGEKPYQNVKLSSINGDIILK